MLQKRFCLKNNNNILRNVCKPIEIRVECINIETLRWPVSIQEHIANNTF